MSDYSVVPGKVFSASELSVELLERIAVYCASRASEFATLKGSGNQLETMARFNFRQETGRELGMPAGILQSASAVICDSRMQPHKWVLSERRILKVDGGAHGDDHFFPGPTDAAWDLAGAIVEWDMDADAEEYLLTKFKEKSGRRAGNVDYFILAYALFRMAYCKMASVGTQDEREKPRLRRAHEYYRGKVNATSGTLLASA